MGDELKPCPFCGHPASGGYWPYIPQSDNKQHGMVAVAQCPNRDCPVQPDITLFSEGLIPEETGTWADVLLRWNTRPVEDALRAELEALRAKWGRIPWDAIKERDGMACQWFAEHPDEEEGYEHAIIRDWLHFDAPKEDTK